MPKALFDLMQAYQNFFIVKDERIKSNGPSADSKTPISVTGLPVTAKLLSNSHIQFISKLKEDFLPFNWECQAPSELLWNKMDPTQTFWASAQEFRVMNLVLRGTNPILSDTMIHYRLEASMSMISVASAILRRLTKLNS
ncbi:hypothetical protein CVT25_005188 [Psilocybe cyanescens]|uniref:Uncharacterized protein n=1 Tax=Psilocybe cyanescens TaxID=93625 RepID=A0A409XBR1_PSICY|nr:hypothetical protein CVT25_005188 [Psilocybe cyanescens]